MQSDKERIEKIVTRCNDLTDTNASWSNYFQDLASWCMPRKANITIQKSKGDRLKLDQVYDSTAIRGLKIMGAGFSSSLTNPASKWFNLRTRDLNYMKNRDIQIWFKEVEDIIFGTLASSNFDTTMQEFYLDAGCFGTGVILTLEDAKEKVRFTEIPIEQVMLEEDAYGRVNRVYRTFSLTTQQAYDLWGDQAGEAVKDQMKKKPNEQMKFLHYVAPRDARDVSKSDSKNMAYMSLWIEKTKKHLISESGYLENPYAVGRFYKDTNDVFGYSPVMDVLPDIKLVNAQVKTMLRVAMKQSDPALIAPRRGFVAPLNGNPGAINYRDDKTASDAITAMPMGGQLPITLEVIQQVQANIEKALFVPLFQAISNITKQMTIPEVQRRISENMILLGPVVGRFTQEVLDPIILRVFNILWNAKEFPLPPAELEGQDMDIVYISPLARSQKESEVFSIQAFMQDVGLIAQAKPEVLDMINGDKTIDIISQIRGISPDIINSEEEVQATRDARAKQMAEMQQAQAIQQGASIAKDGASANKDLAESEAVESEE